MRKIRVVLADDHAMVRDGLQAILANEPDIEVVGTCGDGRTALALAADLAPDVVVMDVGMPDLNGIEATRRMRNEAPNVAVVALSVYSDKRYVLNMLTAGAAAYVLKASAHEELLRAVRAVGSGKHYLSPEITGLVIEEHGSPVPTPGTSPYRVLRPREREILQLLAEGKSSRDISRELCISVKTVETHRRNIMSRLEIRSIAELTKYALREGLTTLD